MSKMTLEQVRDNLRLMHAGIVANNYMGQMADVIDAHLARQPDLAAMQGDDVVRDAARAVPSDWVEKHQIAAGDCPPQSMVILVYSLHRKGYIVASKDAQPKVQP